MDRLIKQYLKQCFHSTSQNANVYTVNVITHFNNYPFGILETLYLQTERALHDESAQWDTMFLVLD